MSPTVARLLLAGAIGSLLPHSDARAQSSDSTRSESSGLRRDSVAQELAAVTINDNLRRRSRYSVDRTASATRTPSLLRDVPQSVTVVSRSLIADQAMQSMADVARVVPGLSMALGEGHRDAPTLRGNSSTADFFVDGVRDDAQYLRDLYNVDRIEVLKGSNAMAFGRGGGGGVINRVSREAQWMPMRDVLLQGGSFEHARATIDLGNAISARAAARVNGVYESSGGFRDGTRVDRSGVNPTFGFRANGRTLLRAGYEHFDDRRTVDRGVPSYLGRPIGAPITAFFGDVAGNRSRATVNALTTTIEHDNAHGTVVRNRTRIADYDKYYRNVFPGGVIDSGRMVLLQAYDHGIDRRNIFNQTEATFTAATGALEHKFLVGTEISAQRTEQFRNTGYFRNTATSLSVPVSSPSPTSAVTYRQSASDADSWALATVTSAFVQDQLAISKHVSVIAGLRYEQFRMRYHNNRSGTELSRRDALLSPRAGLILKPTEPVSLYGSYSTSFLPSSGDQFTSLTVTSQSLEPEQFTNREIGIKWEPRRSLAFNSALYRLDRTNSTAPNPADASRTVQSGAQRTSGVEFGLTGELTNAWQIVAGYATQRARITSTTSAAKQGATVPLVPHSTFSLWNRFNARKDLGVGLGVVHQTRMYAAIDNSVELPAFTRLDGAFYLPIVWGLRVQANVENVLNTRYYGTSHGNNNIMPGATRTLRVSVGLRPGLH